MEQRDPGGRPSPRAKRWWIWDAPRRRLETQKQTPSAPNKAWADLAAKYGDLELVAKALSTYIKGGMERSAGMT